MPTFTVLTADSVIDVDAVVVGEAVVVGAPVLDRTIGWHLTDQGLCRDDVCVPVHPDDPMRTDTGVDIVAAASAIGRNVVVDTRRRIAAISVDGGVRAAALSDGVLPDMSFADLDGNERRIAEFARRKKLLVAFASW